MNRALLIVDMQNDYFPGGKMELIGINEAAENARRLLATFRDAGRPIFHIQHLSTRPGAVFFLPDTYGVEIHPAVAPRDGEMVISKHFPNSFRETILLEELRRRDIKELVVCGAMSHMCIDTTVRAGFDLGLSWIVIADGCATRDLYFGNQIIEAAQVHGAYMTSLASGFAVVAKQKEVHDLL